MAAKETNKDLQVLVGAMVMVKPVKLHWKSFTAVLSAHRGRGEGYEGSNAMSKES
jgi:hypothetical protein